MRKRRIWTRCNDEAKRDVIRLMSLSVITRRNAEVYEATWTWIDICRRERDELYGFRVRVDGIG
jgi:hypothetical protein